MGAVVWVLGGLVVDVVPDNDVVSTGRGGFADGEDQSTFERELQKTGIERKIATKTRISTLTNNR